MTVERDAIVALAAELARRSYYQVLGVAADAGHDEIRSRFAELARTYHPDRQGRAIEPELRRALVSIQARLNEAYRVLSQPRKRAAYDRELAGGRVRLDQRCSAGGGFEPGSPAARRFFRMARERELAGDRQGALMQLEMARQLEPDSPAIGEALERLQSAELAVAGPEQKAEPDNEFDTSSGLSEVELFGDLDD